ncbi:MAG TPA: hypothetical protein VG013_16910 [Gemmataceae bacterium]|nr:hypothetical protein [Gemmataceae bacterium]
MAWQLAGVAVLLLSAAGIGWASFQVRAQACWLGTKDWQLCEQAGRVYLVKSDWDRQSSTDEARRWYVSTPTIKDAKGKFLASDPSGRNPAVYLVAKGGANARWVFEIVDRLEPEPSKEDSRFSEGPSGFTFLVKAAAGPFKDWYLAADAPAKPNERKGKEAVRRPLKLVRDWKKRTLFTYIKVSHSVGSKYASPGRRAGHKQERLAIAAPLVDQPAQAGLQAGRKAAGEMWKNLASLTTCSLVSDRLPFRTAERVDCEILTSFASRTWLSPFDLINSRNTSASEASGIGSCSSS